MSEFGSAVAFVIVLFTLGVSGLLYMSLEPLEDTSLQIADNANADQSSTDVLHFVWYIGLPLTIVFSLIPYAWRRSTRRVE